MQIIVVTEQIVIITDIQIMIVVYSNHFLQKHYVYIQARAPGAPVIIVGTHLDVLRNKTTRRNFPPDFEEAMTGMVQKLFLTSSEPDKCGLPNIIDSINISCKTGENIRRLVEIIKNNIFELRHASEWLFEIRAVLQEAETVWDGLKISESDSERA